MRLATIAVAVLALPLFAADEKPAIKEIATKELKIAFPKNSGGAVVPTEITSADELVKSAALAGAADAIKKQVDFTKEKLVMFLWSGSGGDRLAPELKTEDKKSVAVFVLTRGKTFDLRQHTHLYVVPKDAEVKVVGK